MNKQGELLALLKTPSTRADLELLLNQRAVDVNKRLSRLKKKGLIYIQSWVPIEGPGSPAPIYALGNHPDAAPPKGATRAERNRTYRQRHKARISLRRYGTTSPYAATNPFSQIVNSLTQ